MLSQPNNIVLPWYIHKTCYRHNTCSKMVLPWCHIPPKNSNIIHGTLMTLFLLVAAHHSTILARDQHPQHRAKLSLCFLQGRMA